MIDILFLKLRKNWLMRINIGRVYAWQQVCHCIYITIELKLTVTNFVLDLVRRDVFKGLFVNQPKVISQRHISNFIPMDTGIITTFKLMDIMNIPKMNFHLFYTIGILRLEWYFLFGLSYCLQLSLLKLSFLNLNNRKKKKKKRD